MTTTTTPAREIRFERATMDFSLWLDGQIVGYARSYYEGEAALDAIVYSRLQAEAARVEEAAPAASAIAPAQLTPGTVVTFRRIFLTNRKPQKVRTGIVVDAPDAADFLTVKVKGVNYPMTVIVSEVLHIGA
jgi:hypothetical protein